MFPWFRNARPWYSVNRLSITAPLLMAPFNYSLFFWWNLLTSAPTAGFCLMLALEGKETHLWLTVMGAMLFILALCVFGLWNEQGKLFTK